MTPHCQPANKSFIVTIDGPAGSGKTTVSRVVAESLGFDYVDTGALYRGVALMAVQSKISLADDAALERLCRSLFIQLVREERGLRLLVNGIDISDEIRTPQISMAASAVSARPVVRDYLLKLQRNLGHDRRAVFEGRDMGTVVFPNADMKFFLDAEVNIRAERRYLEMAPEPDLTIEQVKKEMVIRDTNDASRDVAPLKAANDAVRLDTTNLTIDQVVARIVEGVNACLDPHTGD